MPTLEKQKNNKAKMVKVYSVAFIIFLDVLFLPWLMRLPSFILKDPSKGADLWLRYGFIKAIGDLFTNSLYRSIFLVLQMLVLVLIIAIIWNPNKIKRKNKISDGIGGPNPAGDGQHGTSRWQMEKEKDKSCRVWYSGEPLKAGGPVMGMEIQKDGREKIWIDDQDTNTLIIGTTRSGKSRTENLPTIWVLAEAGESMIVGDPKGELFIYSKEMLENKGYDVIALNFRDPSKGNQWNMLDMVCRCVDAGDIPKASRLAWKIASSITKQGPSTSSDPIWKNGEESIIASLILLVCMNAEFKFQRHMSSVYYLLAEYGRPGPDDFIPLIDYINALPVKHPAKAAFAPASIAPSKTRASFFTQALTDLRLFADPNIADLTAVQDHEMANIGIKKTAVFLIIPDEETTYNVMATLYVDQVYQAMVDLANTKGGRIPKRVTYLLDEFGNLPAIPEFDKKLTVCLGRGMRFVLSVQDVTQLKKLYDKNAQTITGNCHNWIYLLTTDTETAKIISEKTGKYTVETDNLSTNVQNKGNSFGASVSLTGRALLMPEEIERWPMYKSLVLRARQFPAQFALPDLGKYKANQQFGFVKPSGNIDKDKKLNLAIIENRWNDIPERELQDVSIWLPELNLSKGEETQQEAAQTDIPPNVDKPPYDDIHQYNQAYSEVAVPDNIQELLQMAYSMQGGDEDVGDSDDFLG